MEGNMQNVWSVNGASQAIRNYSLTNHGVQGRSGDPDGGADAATEGILKPSPAATVSLSARALNLMAAHGGSDGDGK